MTKTHRKPRPRPRPRSRPAAALLKRVPTWSYAFAALAVAFAVLCLVVAYLVVAIRQDQASIRQMQQRPALTAPAARDTPASQAWTLLRPAGG